MRQVKARRNYWSTGVLFMLLLIALGALAVGYGLWSKSLFISGTVNTGNVDAEFTGAFTDDDDMVDDVDKDSLDTGDCPLPVGSNTSCDPAASGPDPKPRYDKDVARCDAEFTGPTTATITKTNVYPSYYCTAWFDVHNSGSIPVKVAGATVNGQPIVPSVPTPFDLDNADGDNNNATGADVEIHLTGLDSCQQIDPSETVQIDVDQHILQDAPQGATLSYTLEIQLNQWNEPCADQIIDADGIATTGDGLGTCGSPVTPGSVGVSVGAPLTSWPTGGDPDDHGIDILEGVVDSAWTSTCSGDDIHIEGVSAACPTGDRQGTHDVGADCDVLDYDGSMVQDQAVDCDLETGTFCTGSLLTDLVFHDANGDGYYDNGEDIVLDGNNNGVFD